MGFVGTKFLKGFRVNTKRDNRRRGDSGTRTMSMVFCSSYAQVISNRGDAWMTGMASPKIVLEKSVTGKLELGRLGPLWAHRQDA